MRILSVNIRGFKQDMKVDWFKRMISTSNPIVAAVQETKHKKIKDSWVEYMWRAQNVEYVAKQAEGRSGGLILMWDCNVFNVNQAVEGEFFIAIKGKLSNFDTEIAIVNVYGPHSDMWNELSIIALNRKLSDHTPLLLRNGQSDFGPKPIRIFDELLEADGTKLKNVKESLKVWCKNSFESLDTELQRLSDDCKNWEIKAEDGSLLLDERAKWIESRGKWVQKDRAKRSMLKQKARVKWATDGDENSRFFHSIIEQRNNKNNIRGLHIDETWQEDPNLIKDEVQRHFKAFYEDHDKKGFCFNGFETSKIYEEDADGLELPFSEEKVWNAIKVVGFPKLPGPMVLTLNFIENFGGSLKPT
ncbi:uncharacterized protein [Rutidosis leptorrhynchoides]|uniref:uncharacterized protein n=1 Tax=Rutidosis leptorrhynchoides TaxID=125765 RepID=UPI003A9A0E46